MSNESIFDHFWHGSWRPLFTWVTARVKATERAEIQLITELTRWTPLLAGRRARAFHLKMPGEWLIAHLKLPWRAILSRNNHSYIRDGKWWIIRDFRYILSTRTVIDGDTRDDELKKNCFQVFVYDSIICMERDLSSVRERLIAHVDRGLRERWRARAIAHLKWKALAGPIFSKTK